MNDYIGKLLKYDPLAEAERATGESYKTDEGTMALGFLAAMQHGQVKEAALIASHDTHYSIPWSEFLKIIFDLGFTVFYETATRDTDRYIVAWAKDGILLRADSFHNVLNSGNIYYNWLAHEDVLENRWEFTSSGRWYENDLLVGDHPAIEGLRYTVDRMRKNGDFLTLWEHRPFLWLNPKEVDNYEAATDEIIATLPHEVQVSITPTEV